MSGIYQKQVNSGSVASPSAGRTLISVNETGELFTKDSSGNVIVYPTSSNGGGGGGSPFPFTGSADISGTLNVNYSDAFTFGVDENFSQSITEYISGFGGWTTLPLTGTSIGSKIDFANNEIYDFTLDGNVSIPAIPGASFPTLVSGQYVLINDGILSGSTVANGVNVFDQSGFGGSVAINNAIRTVINNTLSGSNILYEVGTSFEQNDEYSDLVFNKINEAGEIIELNFNSDFTGLSLFSDLTDVDAEIFRIVDTSDDFANLFSINKGGPDIYSGQFGFQINQPSSAFTESLFNIYDSDDNNLFRVNASGSTTIQSPSSGSGEQIFMVLNGSRIALQINDIDSTILHDVNLYLSKFLPTSSADLNAGQVYTQTATELGGSGATKVLCIV